MYKVSMKEQEFIGEVGKIVPSVDFSSTTTSKSITLKIMAYAPDTYQSAGAIALNTDLKAE